MNFSLSLFPLTLFLSSSLSFLPLSQLLLLNTFPFSVTNIKSMIMMNNLWKKTPVILFIIHYNSRFKHFLSFLSLSSLFLSTPSNFDEMKGAREKEKEWKDEIE